MEQIGLLHFSAMEFHEEDIASGEGIEPFMLAEVLASGVDRTGERHGANYVRTAPGYRLKLKEFLDARNEKGRKLEIITEDDPEAERIIQAWKCTAICSSTMESL